MNRPDHRYEAIRDRDHAADGRKSAAARKQNEGRRRLERLERGIASGELKTMAAWKLLELELERQADLEAARIAADREVSAKRAELEALVRQQETELARLADYRDVADEWTDRIEALEQ